MAVINDAGVMRDRGNEGVMRDRAQFFCRFLFFPGGGTAGRWDRKTPAEKGLQASDEITLPAGTTGLKIIGLCP